MREISPTVYILTNSTHRVLYVGVTSNLVKRIFEHQNLVDLKSFTNKYKVHKLIYYAPLDTMDEAISLEKKLKAGTRKKERRAHYPDEPQLD